MYAEGTSMSPSVQTPGATLKHLASNLATHHMVIQNEGCDDAL